MKGARAGVSAISWAKASRRSCCGQSTNTDTAPTIAILARPLPKLTQASLPNMRLSPAIGEIRLSLGVIGSRLKSGRCWIARRRPGASMSDERHGERPRRADQRALRDGSSAGAVDRKALGVHEEAAQDGAASRATARATSKRERDGAEHEPRGQLLALGDVATLDRLVELSLRRVYCSVVVLGSSAMAPSPEHLEAVAGGSRARRSAIIVAMSREQEAARA